MADTQIDLGHYSIEDDLRKPYPDHSPNIHDIAGLTVFGAVSEGSLVRDLEGNWWKVTFDSEIGDYCLVSLEA